ncbi:MAG: 4'-phosphopantetheinyl transferase superfamily protein [Saprospiraceae bacterium]|nr:4'-phosphopantetheinyl transferase superfamily protein [Saprospiraceae bacterium]
MPLLLTRHPFPKTRFGIWQIAEEEDFFRADLPLTAQEEQEWQSHKGIRSSEWLAGRWLLHRLTGVAQRMPLAKDAFSKPFFPNNAQFLCSLSHSKGIVGALLLSDAAPGALIGCDIQVLVDKMPRIAPRFLSAPEIDFVRQHSLSDQFDLYHAFWTAKESMYKAYGLKELDFREHIRVFDFEWKEQHTRAAAVVRKGSFEQLFTLIIEKMALPETGALLHTVCLSAQPAPDIIP